MRCALTIALTLLAATSAASAHTIFPGQQTVWTAGDRAIAKFQAANARQDVSQFVVEIFDAPAWTPSRSAVAMPPRLTLRARRPDSIQSGNQPFSILVDLDGRTERRFRVCTKTLASSSALQPNKTQVNTRVCSNLTVRKLTP